MAERPRGVYVFLVLSILVGSITAFLYQEPSNGFLRYLGYFIILSGISLFRLNKWVRRGLLAISIAYVLFYGHFAYMAFFVIEEGRASAMMGLTALLPTFIYAAGLLIYLSRGKVR